MAVHSQARGLERRRRDAATQLQDGPPETRVFLPPTEATRGWESHSLAPETPSSPLGYPTPRHSHGTTVTTEGPDTDIDFCQFRLTSVKSLNWLYDPHIVV